MDQWTVVTSLSVLAALTAAVAGPIVKLNGTISRLSAILEHVLHRLDKLEGEDQRLRAREEDLERRLSGRFNQQEKRLGRCENRLALLEGKRGGRHGVDQLEGAP